MKSKENQQSINDISERIKEILIKKSEGYYYNEEILEYQNKTTNEEEKQLNIFENNNEDKRKTKKQDKNSDLILIKKKVTTHYIPPDLLALKMLFEIFGEEVINDDLTQLSDKELYEIKSEIISKLNDI